ncbi:uncharacterized protein LOC128578993 [Nycticebus coucang]|uniref:uncharacterized protein LOC128578993 n=1 Tax=Nycticebus coucang TaxID=9470 RepID=UPI00234CA895|nr:uncharacterized protein LOC128578993 [Nycticebus coucang]
MLPEPAGSPALSSSAKTLGRERWGRGAPRQCPVSGRLRADLGSTWPASARLRLQPAPLGTLAAPPGSRGAGWRSPMKTTTEPSRQRGLFAARGAPNFVAAKLAWSWLPRRSLSYDKGFATVHCPPCVLSICLPGPDISSNREKLCHGRSSLERAGWGRISRVLALLLPFTLEPEGSKSQAASAGGLQSADYHADAGRSMTRHTFHDNRPLNTISRISSGSDILLTDPGAPTGRRTTQAATETRVHTK